MIMEDRSTSSSYNVTLDEEKPHLLQRIISRKIDYTIRIVYYLTSGEPISTAIVAIFVIILVTLIYLYHQKRKQKSSINFKRSSSSSSSSLNKTSHPYRNSMINNNELVGSKTILNDYSSKLLFNQQQTNTKAFEKRKGDELKILELKAETYNGMIRLLKPGHRSIILLTDLETKEQLLPPFKEAVWPYRKNKTLLFGYLCLDRNLEWYAALLKNILGLDELNVNKKNCVGTVLSLNGFRNYFRVYHAKHSENVSYTDEEDSEEDGSFLSFNGDLEAKSSIQKCAVDEGKSAKEQITSDNLRQEICTIANLLERLPDWLEKMFHGMTKRYYLDSWPEEMN